MSKFTGPERGAPERYARLYHKHKNKKYTPLNDQARGDLIQFLTGSRADHCDLCGDRVTSKNLSSWDDDGHVYCTAHGPLAEKMRNTQ